MNCKKCNKDIPDDSVFCPYCGRKQIVERKRKRRPNGTGSVCKVSGKRKKPWLARIQKDDIRYTVGYFKTEAEAMIAVAKYEPETKEEKERVYTLLDVWNIINQRKKKISESAKHVRELSISKLQPLWYKDVSTLRTEDYQKVLDSLASELATGTIKHVRTTISQIGKWCVANELIKFNPSTYLETPEGQDKKKDKETFTDEDIAKLWADDSDEAHIVLALIYTGLRIDELFSLKPDDIHLGDKGYDYLIGGEKTEAGKGRIVMIHPRILPYFQSWVSAKKKYLITSIHGGKITISGWRRDHYYPLLDRLGIERISPHGARHTFATMISKAGGNASALQKTMGHASFTTTANIYTHPDFDALKKVVETLK